MMEDMARDAAYELFVGDLDEAREIVLAAIGLRGAQADRAMAKRAKVVRRRRRDERWEQACRDARLTRYRARQDDEVPIAFKPLDQRPTSDQCESQDVVLTTIPAVDEVHLEQ
jgi:hypothetical protein